MGVKRVCGVCASVVFAIFHAFRFMTFSQYTSNVCSKVGYLTSPPSRPPLHRPCQKSHALSYAPSPPMISISCATMCLPTGAGSNLQRSASSAALSIKHKPSFLPLRSPAHSPIGQSPLGHVHQAWPSRASPSCHRPSCLPHFRYLYCPMPGYAPSQLNLTHWHPLLLLAAQRLNPLLLLRPG
jgi:hypothetical protein